MRTSSNTAVLERETPADSLPVKTSSFRHATSYLAAAYISRGICAFRAFINARWLGPEIYGFFGTLSFITSFAYQLHLGTLEVMVKEVPGLLRRKKEFEAQRIAHITFTFYLVMLLFACTAMWIYAFNLPPSTPSYVRIGWIAGSLILGLEVFYDFQQTLSRAKQQFRSISMGILAANFLSFLLTFWLVRSYQFYGYLAVAIVTPLMGLIFIAKSTHESWKLAWSFSTIKSMVRKGFSILTMTLVFKAVWWIDRILVLHFAGSHGFGYYLLGTMTAQICFLFPEVLASVMEPKIHYDYAAEENPEHIRKHFNNSLLTLSFLMPLGFLVADFSIPFFITTALPQYSPAIPCVRILIWGSLLMGISACTKAFMVALNRQAKVLWIYGVAILANLASGIFLGMHGAGIAGIAAAALLGYFVCSTGLLIYAFRSLGDSFSAISRQIAGLYSYPVLAFLFGIAAPEYFSQSLRISLPALQALAILIYAGFISWEVEQKIGFKQIISWFRKTSDAQIAGAPVL